MGRADPGHRVGSFFARAGRWAALGLLATGAWAEEPTPAPPATPASLTARWEDELATQEWTLAKSGERPSWQPAPPAPPWPLHLALTDASTGERAPMVASADFRAEERRRWGGRTLGVDWVLVLDGMTGDVLTVTGQFKSSRPRVLTLEAGAALDLTDWIDQSATGSIRRANLLLEALSDPQEPRLHQTVTERAAAWFGLRYFLGLPAPADGAVARTTFRFQLRLQTGPGEPPPPPASLTSGQDSERIAARIAFLRAQTRGAGPFAQLPSDAVRDPTVFAALALTNLVVVDSQTSLEVLLHNGTEATQDIRVATTGDFAEAQQQVILHPGESQLVVLSISSEEPAAGAQTVIAESADARVLEQRLPVSFLAPESSLARDSRVAVEVDSTQAGTFPSALTDGLMDGAAGSNATPGWASEETMSPHRIRLTFPSPTSVTEVRLVWPQQDGHRYSSTRGRLLGWTDHGAWVDLARVDQQAEVEETLLSFSAVRLKAIEWRQPPGSGHPRRPNLLWLNELEVR